MQQSGERGYVRHLEQSVTTHSRRASGRVVSARLRTFAESVRFGLSHALPQRRGDASSPLPSQSPCVQSLHAARHRRRSGFPLWLQPGFPEQHGLRLPVTGRGGLEVDPEGCRSTSVRAPRAFRAGRWSTGTWRQSQAMRIIVTHHFKWRDWPFLPISCASPVRARSDCLTISGHTQIMPSEYFHDRDPGHTVSALRRASPQLRIPLEHSGGVP
jgi:hypothetical protein